MVNALQQNAIDVAQDAAQTVLCGAGGASRFANDLFDRVSPFYSQSPGGRLARLGQRALESFCPVPPPVPPGDYLPGDPPFSGGQCMMAPYRLAFSFLGSPSSSGIVFGPISEAGFVLTGPGPSFGQVRITGFDSSGNPLTLSPASGNAESFSDFQLIRTDGQPDDCGDPPPAPPAVEPPPPNDPSPPGTDIVVDLPDVGPTNITFSPTVGPFYIDVGLNIRVPVRVNIRNTNIGINFPIDVDINLTDPTDPPRIPPGEPDDENPDGRPRLPDCPPPPPCDEMPEEPEDPDEEPNEPDEPLREVLAIVVRSTVDRSAVAASEIAQDSGANIWAPRLGNIQFSYETTDGSVVWSPDFPIKTENFIQDSPYMGLLCTGAVATPDRGVTLQVSTIVGPARVRESGCGG